jgi:hypothetical protein
MSRPSGAAITQVGNVYRTGFGASGLVRVTGAAMSRSGAVTLTGPGTTSFPFFVNGQTINCFGVDGVPAANRRTSVTGATANSIDLSFTKFSGSYVPNTGYCDPETGWGNGDFYLGPDYVHPTTAGHTAAGQLMGQLIYQALSGRQAGAGWRGEGSRAGDGK